MGSRLDEMVLEAKVAKATKAINDKIDHKFSTEFKVSLSPEMSSQLAELRFLLELKCEDDCLLLCKLISFMRNHYCKKHEAYNAYLEAQVVANKIIKDILNP